MDKQLRTLQLLHDTIMIYILQAPTTESPDYQRGYKEGLERFREYFYGPDSTVLEVVDNAQD